MSYWAEPTTMTEIKLCFIREDILSVCPKILEEFPIS